MVADHDILTPEDQQLTVCLWGKVHLLRDRFFLYKGSSTVNREYAIGVNASSLASFGIYNQGGYKEDQYGNPSETVIEDSVWYFIAGTWDGTTSKIYINGVLEHEIYPPAIIGNYNSDLYIGTYGSKISQYSINGVIDDVRIYNRALSSEEIETLYGEGISADFVAQPTLGVAPLSVIFTDLSSSADTLNPINSWQWDFEDDGIIDLEGQNPEWIYTDPGVYTVKLIVADSVFSSTRIKKDYIKVLSEKPIIISIEDVPDDQGGWVKLNFLRSIYDTDTLNLTKSLTAELYTIEINDGSGWVAANSTVAYAATQYSVLVHTTKDYLSGSDGPIDFRVIAAMDEGNYVSDIKSGYSVDNLAPAVPEGLAAQHGEGSQIALSWNPSIDEDLKGFNIYRNLTGTFDSADQPYAQSIENEFRDDQVELAIRYYYAVSAFDISGNESHLSDPVSASITAIDKSDHQLPITYFLEQNFPNPFNPRTVIRWQLAGSSDVELSVYNLLGRKIATLVSERQEAGYYQITWDASRFACGIYFYRIEAGEFQDVKKMIFLK